MKKIVMFLAFSLIICTLNAQNNKAGNIVQIKNGEILVKNENPEEPFLIGEKLHLLTGDKNIIIEVTFPMQAASKCRLTAGNIAKLKPGMVVFSGGAPAQSPAAVGSHDTGKTESVSRIVRGKDEQYSLSGNVNFIMKDTCVPNDGITFPMGIDDAERGTITAPFLMQETDVTFKLWKAVRIWAEAHGYVFANAGQNGQTKDFKALSESESTEYPVVMVNWRDCIVWCNALTEYYNANNGKAPDFDCVYYADSDYKTPIRTASNEETIQAAVDGSEDCPYIKANSSGNTDMISCTAKGFRLPSSMEYEYAARYRGTDKTNTVEGFSNPYFTKGNSAIGAVADYKNKVASFYDDDTSTQTSLVKKKRPNALGLYDVGGNVYKWCYDWFSGNTGSYRVLRGGSFLRLANIIKIGNPNFSCPDNAYFDYGFRFVRNK